MYPAKLLLKTLFNFPFTDVLAAYLLYNLVNGEEFVSLEEMVFPFFQGVYLAEHAPFSLGCRKTGAEWKAPGCSDSPLPPSDAWFSLFALPVTTQVLCVFSQQAPHGRGTHSLTTV